MKTELEHAQDRMNKIVEYVGPSPNVVEWCDAEADYRFWYLRGKQLKAKRLRVEKRRARVRRTFEAWNVAQGNHPDDVAFWLRKAIQTDQLYHPEAWPVKEGE